VQRAQDRIPRECPGAAIGWALGGSGAWTLAAADTRDPAFKAVAMFYPALVRAQSYRNTLPVLVLQGTADDIMPERALRSFVGNRAGRSAPAEIVMLEGAAHGFDVPSLQPPRTLGSALVGRPQVFAYNAGAARTAQQALERFLTEQGVVGGACAR
jgi:dienelactone hydrolase